MSLLFSTFKLSVTLGIIIVIIIVICIVIVPIIVMLAPMLPTSTPCGIGVIVGAAATVPHFGIVVEFFLLSL